ncbi:Ff.00g114150.m01.CDS01 [Fusarium sp. VM40]|nr:Ff.00g114150.m01.CDS01 [Fusarium sp. VM40]
MDSPPDPPSILFQGLSLGAGQTSPQSGSSHAVSPGQSRGKIDLSFSSPRSGSSISPEDEGVFVFGQPSLNRSISSSSVFQFGGRDQNVASTNRDTRAESFEFGTLHNMTPLPSPSPSRATTPQRIHQPQSPFTHLTTPPAKGSHLTSENGTKAPLFSFLSPSSSDSRRQSSSVLPSTPSTPSQPRVKAPESSFVASPTPEPSAPITPYDDRAEAAPPHALFMATFQDALKLGSDIAQKAVRSIEKVQAGASGEIDSEIDKLLGDAKSLQRFHGTDTRTIAVLGDSGEGKSSLINSLLHFPGVAQTGDIGSACTSVVTEYRQKKAGHTDPITIDVEYLSGLEIRELIKELLWSYRQLFLPGVESSETSEQDYNRYMRQSEQAWSALHAAFKHKRQFTQRFAQDMSDGALERITNQLIEWSREIEWPTSGADGFWTSTAQTAEECVEQTKLFMQDKFWPFTKIIRVYLNSQVLKTGVVLADLPGLQDTNLARVRATQDYLIKCDNILIVAKISRAITDQSLKSSLFYVLSRHMPTEWEQSGTQRLNVSVVCTKSEEINLRTARLEFCGPNHSISNETMTRLDDEINSAKNAGDRTKKKAAKKKQELLLVQARNEHVKRNLQSVYSSEMNGRTLDVFCVSNKWYEKYCPKGNTEFVEASGIPGLRRFCHTVTADAQLNEAKHFLRSRLSALLNTLDLWASSSLQKQDEIEEPDDSIHTTLTELIGQMPSLVNTFQQDFMTCFREQIMTFFGRRDQHWDQAATKESLVWTTWHWTQYNAWCLNNGVHETLKRGHENWNAKIIWKMRMELEGQWDLVEEEVCDVFEALLNDAKSRLESFKSSLYDSLPQLLVEPIVESVTVQIGNLEYCMGREQRQLSAEVRAIRRYASESNYNSYILQDMVPVYRSAASQCGTGKAARQRSIVQGHIEQGVIFPQMAVAISESMDKLIKTTSGRLNTILRSVLATIESDLDIVFQSYQRSHASPPTHYEGQEDKMNEFADEIRDLGQRHKQLLQSIEAI